MKKILKTKKGFTLIELLVVIGIIGILSTIGAVSFGSARGKARDAKRISDARQIQSLVEVRGSTYDGYYVTDTSADTVPGTTKWATFMTVLGQTTAIRPETNTNYCYYAKVAAAAAAADTSTMYTIVAIGLEDEGNANNGFDATTVAGDLLSLVSAYSTSACPAAGAAVTINCNSRIGTTGNTTDNTICFQGTK